jgi:hypothetical protein
MYRVMMVLDGAEVPSSCVRVGTLRQCEGTAARLMRQKDRDRRVGWVVLPCIS